MKLTFIVNGTETIVTVESSDILLNDACETALEQTGNNGRNVLDFQAICNDQTLDMNSKINDQWVRDQNWIKTKIPISLDERVIFLSLKAGIGG